MSSSVLSSPPFYVLRYRKELGTGLTAARLIKCTVEMTRCKLDRTYLEALSTAAVSVPKHSDATDPAEVSALREEVDSLYAEIFPVVQMSVENQFLQPAVRRTSSRNARALDNSSVAVDYVRKPLTAAQRCREADTGALDE